ncbi:MBL fold metallo-hydrolase RNA specificity domain-containing protein [Kibdelosporangium philippinense]
MSRDRGPEPSVTYPVHGEREASTALAERLRSEYAVVPRDGERVLV